MNFKSDLNVWKIVQTLSLNVFAVISLTSCAVQRHKINAVSVNQDKKHLVAEPAGKFIRVKTTISQEAKNSGLQIFAKENLKTKMILFQCLVKDFLSKWDTFDSVHDFPSAEEEKKHPKKYDDDYSLEITVEDITVSDHSNNFTRIVSFGFSPQKLEKQLRFTIIISDRKRDMTQTLTKKVDLTLSLKKLGDAYPWDLSQHGWFIEKQAQLYLDIIKPELSNAFGRPTALTH